MEKPCLRFSIFFGVTPLPRHLQVSSQKRAEFSAVGDGNDLCFSGKSPYSRPWPLRRLQERSGQTPAAFFFGPDFIGRRHRLWGYCAPSASPTDETCAERP